MSWIQGDKFERVGDFTYSPIVKIGGDYSRLPSTFNPEKLRDINIVYTHTFYVKQLFSVIAPMKHRFVIVTHNCDNNVDFEPPANVIKWFAQNVNISHEKIESIPIGLENSRWFPEVDKIGKMQKKLQQKKTFKNMVYMNHNISTNPMTRKRPYEVLKDMEWVTTSMGSNGQGFDNYLENIYNHPFVICPQGNGIDTHRTWECLYLNTIPIEKRNINNQFYKDLPILFVDSWDEINEKFLLDSYMRITEEKWNLNKLNFEYWREKINGFSNNIISD